MIPRFVLISSLLISQAGVSSAQQSIPVRVDIAFENWQMSLLARVKQKPGMEIIPFITDGCSGGMSEAWTYIATAIPAFADKLGQHPPWEHCCVEHDRAYWRGETKDGYTLRLKADQELQACVEQFGMKNSSNYATRFSTDKQAIERHFNIAAKMMYRAVRLGGKPCSFLPWRWGYGWPHCISGYTEK